MKTHNQTTAVTRVSAVFVLGTALLGTSLAALPGEANAAETRAQISTTSVLGTLSPKQLSTSATLKNTGTGQYNWQGQNKAPQYTNQDSYQRLFWSDIEPQKGVYNTWAIDQGLAQAAKSGGTFGFRVMAVCEGCGKSKAGSVLPSDMNQKAWTTKDGLRVPDWNSGEFQQRWADLMKHLGSKYNGDPRLAYVDVGGYGNWGEWHSYPFEQQYTGSGQRKDITTINAQRMVGAVTSNFSKSHVTMPTTGNRTADDNGVPKKTRTFDWSNKVWRYGLWKAPNLGIRNDCLGAGVEQAHAVEGYQHAVSFTGGATGSMANRWKTAPVVTEYCAPSSFPSSTGQIQGAHVSMLSSGNYAKPLSGYSASDKVGYHNNVAKAGYRYLLKSTKITRESTGAVKLSTEWLNQGVAPTYSDWTVKYIFRNTSTGAVNTVDSTVDLTKVLPGSHTAIDVYDLGSPTGAAYEVSVAVVPKASHVKPMSLALENRKPDGSYVLGTLRY